MNSPSAMSRSTASSARVEPNSIVSPLSSIRLTGETLAIEGLDFRTLEASRGFTDYLHSFAWLRDLSTVATRATGAPATDATTAHIVAAMSSLALLRTPREFAVGVGTRGS